MSRIQNVPFECPGGSVTAATPREGRDRGSSGSTAVRSGAMTRSKCADDRNHTALLRYVPLFRARRNDLLYTLDVTVW